MYLTHGELKIVVAMVADSLSSMPIALVDIIVFDYLDDARFRCSVCSENEHNESKGLYECAGCRVQFCQDCRTGGGYESDFSSLEWCPDCFDANLETDEA
jgi:hypothetical protein